MNDEPLIYTTKGNVPVASLRFVPEWQLLAGGKLVWSSLTDLHAPLPAFDQIAYVEAYYDAGDELVKRSAAVFAPTSAGVAAQQGTFGG